MTLLSFDKLGACQLSKKVGLLATDKLGACEMDVYLIKPLMNCVLRQARSLSNALKSYFEAPEYLAQNFFELLTSQSLSKVPEPSPGAHLMLDGSGKLGLVKRSFFIVF